MFPLCTYADNFANADDVEPEEGSFYVWDFAELQRLLSESEQAALMDVFTVSETDDFEGRNVLRRRDSGLLSGTALVGLP